MALTRDFKETIRARVRRDPAFRKELLREGIESFLSGDVETGKTVLRDYINATIGFAELGEITHHSPKSLMRMLGPSGNPHANNLFEIVAYLQRRKGFVSSYARRRQPPRAARPFRLSWLPHTSYETRAHPSPASRCIAHARSCVNAGSSAPSRKSQHLQSGSDR